MKNKLVIIDGNSLLYKSFFALPLLSIDTGEYTNAVYGFANTIIKIINDIKPTHMCVAFDYSKHTFRNDMFADYKATRKEMPAELRSQIEPVRKMLDLMKIKYIEKEGFEADDIIGTLSKRFSGVEKIIVTGDRDSFQLISNDVSVFFNFKGMTDVKIMNLDAMKNEYGLTPDEFIHLKALQGDNSDNIPGVRGIGPKTAIELIQKYKSLDNIYANINNEKPAVANKLEQGKNMAYLSYELSKIKCDVDIDVDISNLDFEFPFSQDVYNFFARYKFISIIKKEGYFKQEAQKQKAATFENKIELIKIDDVKKLQNCIENIEKSGVFSLFHTNNNEIHLSTEKYEWYFSSEISMFGDDVYEQYFASIKPIMVNENIRKIFFDSKALRHVYSTYNIEIKGKFDDLSIMYNVTEGKVVKYFEDIFDLSEYDVKNYPANSLLRLYDVLKNKINELSLNLLYSEVELPLSVVLFDMEKTGFKVDLNRLEEIGQMYKKEIDDLTLKIYEIVGTKFNINSSMQIAEILFDKLNLPHNKKKSTGAEVLEEIQDMHPIVPLILRYRKVNKLYSTYIVGLKPHIDENDFVHTTFNQTLTATGRLSSSEPNLQNIPIRSDESRQIRSIYVASSKNNVLIDADYSQIELRLLAHFSEDEFFIDAFNNNFDIHTQTACQVFNVTKENVTPQMRRIAKVVNFGIIYGISTFGLANDLKIFPKDAAKFIDSFYELHPKVREYLDKIIIDAKNNGKVSTLLGRFRTAKELSATNFMVRKAAERALQNMPLQGSAADIIKLAMIKIYNTLKNGGFKAKLIMQVHDELIIDCPENEAEQVKELVREAMNTAYQLKVPLICDMTSSYRWSDGH